jgi:hypothetical protein
MEGGTEFFLQFITLLMSIYNKSILFIEQKCTFEYNRKFLKKKMLLKMTSFFCQNNNNNKKKFYCFIVQVAPYILICALHKDASLPKTRQLLELFLDLLLIYSIALKHNSFSLGA